VHSINEDIFRVFVVDYGGLNVDIW